MIGLGSNKLSVCRRGGMRVTQAGRGGMEWLAGGRVPSWASPYSAQATAALKAQFPTQWPTIRDYGFAHPEIVPFINEDPMLVMSLIDGLGTRWLNAPDGNVYINTGITVLSTDKIEVKYKYAQFIQNYAGLIYGAYDMNAGTDYHSRYYVASAGGSGASRYDYDGNYEIQSFAYGVAHNIVDYGGQFYVDGTRYVNVSQKTFTCTGPFLLFSTGWTHVPERSKGVSIARAKINEAHEFVPCRHGGENGVLDIVTLTWYGKTGSGSFTISETPANQTP